jgi:hypothetical protein
MSKALAKLKKLRGRSPAELKERGAQALAAFTERRGWSQRTRLPRDAALFALLDPAMTGRGTLTAADLLTHFRTRAAPTFFAAFAEPETTRAELRHRFGPQAASSLLARAQALEEGKFDLLGQRALDFGTPVDWHLEPVSGRRAPLAHWSRINFLDARVAGDKKITWELNRCQHFMTLGRAYWHTGYESCAETFAAHANEWMDANPPARGVNWASSLEVALRSIAWLWALYFFRDSAALTPILFLRLLKFLYAHACHVETYLSTYFAPNTHLTGEALGLYYLGTLLPEFKRAARWRARGHSILLEQLDRHVLPDGVYFEHSTYYQRYSADFYTHFLLLAQANDLALPAGVRRKLEAKLTALLDHLMYITRPDGTTPYVGDDDGGRLAPLDDRAPDDFRATLAVGAGICTRGDYKFVAGNVPESVLWLLGARGLRDYDALAAHTPVAESRAFPDGGYYVMRDGWTSDANYMLLDAGPHGATALNYGHAHADALAFEVSARGRRLLVDPGTYTYTASKEMRDWFRGSIAHNSLTVDGESSSIPDGPFSWKTVARCELLNWISRARFDYVEGRHEGYQRLPFPATHTRNILFLKKDYWVLRDRIHSNGPHRLDIWFHFDADANPLLDSADDKAQFVSENGGRAGLQILAFAKNGYWRREAGWVSKCYGERTPAPVYVFSVMAKGTEDVITFLLPQPTSRSPGLGVKEVEAIGGRAFEFFDENVVDLVMICDGHRVETARLTSDFEWTWARFSRENNIPEELVLIGGSRLELEGREILSSARRIDYLVASRVGEQFRVETDDEILHLRLPIHDFESAFSRLKGL